jgi:hypothetical protein
MKSFYSVYADYGVDDPRTNEYAIGTLEETQKFVQDILDDPSATIKNVGKLTMYIRDVRGNTVSEHPVTREV